MIELLFLSLAAIVYIIYDRLKAVPARVLADTQRQLFIKATAEKAKTLYIDPGEYAYFLAFVSGLSPQNAKLCIDVMNTANSSYISQLYGTTEQTLIDRIYQYDIPLWQLDQFENAIRQVFTLASRIDEWGVEYYLERVLNKSIALNQKLSRVEAGSAALPIDIYENQSVSA